VRTPPVRPARPVPHTADQIVELARVGVEHARQHQVAAERDAAGCFVQGRLLVGMAARPATDLVQPRVGQQLEQQLRQFGPLTAGVVDAAAYVLPALALPRAGVPDERAARLPDGPRQLEAVACLRLTQARGVAFALGRGHLERAALGMVGMVRAAPDVGLGDRDQDGGRLGSEAVAAEPAIPLLRGADHVRAALARFDARAGKCECRQHGAAVIGAERAEHPALLVDDRQHRMPA